ncbi:MAG: 1-acyl-sn-glycerol-3-phosphate acyltransferase [Actinomycetia bacterium]|nr:1-acyl-sn-glycerol-3-phosphate acyltransferase [Actinomycetes bacterium]
MPDIRGRDAHGAMSTASKAFYDLARTLITGWTKLFWRMLVVNGDRIPTDGPFIVAPGGHRSNLDTVVLCAVSRRRLRYMGKHSLWEAGAFGAWFLTSLGGFPVNRDAADREALRVCQEVLGRGEPLVVFPEGLRQEGPLIQPLKDGAAFLACRSGAPIVPVGLGGTERAMPRGSKWIRPSRLVMLVGEPIHPPPRGQGERVKRSQIRALTAELHETLQDLFDEAQIRAGV